MKKKGKQELKTDYKFVKKGTLIMSDNNHNNFPFVFSDLSK